MSDTMKRMYRLEISNAALRGENARLNQEIATLQGIPQSRLLQERVFGISAEEDYVTMLNKQSEELERKETIIMELGIEQVRRDHVFAYEMDRLRMHTSDELRHLRERAELPWQRPVIQECIVHHKFRWDFDCIAREGIVEEADGLGNLFHRKEYVCSREFPCSENHSAHDSGSDEEHGSNSEGRFTDPPEEKDSRELKPTSRSQNSFIPYSSEEKTETENSEQNKSTCHVLEKPFVMPY